MDVPDKWDASLIKIDQDRGCTAECNDTPLFSSRSLPSGAIEPSLRQ